MDRVLVRRCRKPAFQISGRTPHSTQFRGEFLNLPDHIIHFLGRRFSIRSAAPNISRSKSLWGALAADPIFEIAELATERFWFCVSIGCNSLKPSVFAFTAVFAFFAVRRTFSPFGA